ncbi:MAG: ABC transporter permease [Aureispira sp.]|nr:ABC transporter permease [Aureispira sp.]
MHTILTVIKKELRDTLRDKKTLFSAIILPAIAIPLLLFGVTTMQKNLIEKENTKDLKIVLINAPETIQEELKDDHFILLDNIELSNAKDSVKEEIFDAVLEFDSNFKTQIDSLQSGKVNMYYKSTNIMVQSRLNKKLDAYKTRILDQRIQQLQISPEVVKPLVIKDVNIASAKEQIGQVVGGFIPYIFIMLCFMGCMYPALDLITGEKERGTIETLLTVPASRFHILFGKTITIALIGIIAAVVAITGMVVGLNFIGGIPATFMEVISSMVSPKFIIMLMAMLIPLSFFFAGVLSAIVVRTSSFKEAQSYVTPMSFVVIVPAIMAMMPGMELTWQTAFIPILNIALATKDIVAGTIDMMQYGAILLSLITFAVLAIYASFKEFSKEGNVLK